MMRMARKTGWLAGLLCCVFAGGVNADLNLTVIPLAQEVGIGDFVDVEVAISGLGNFAPDSLSLFDLAVGFDSSIIAFLGVLFGDPVLGDQLDLIRGSLTQVFVGAGVVNIAKESFNLPEALDTLQADSFTLATLTFEAVGLGTSPVSLSFLVLEDSSEDRLFPALEDGSVSVVPVPGAVMLGMLGLGMVGWVKRRVA